MSDTSALGGAHECNDAAADGIQRDHAEQQECKYHEGRAALTVAVCAGDHHLDDADQKSRGEEHAAGRGEPKPATEPSPIASESRHA